MQNPDSHKWKNVAHLAVKMCEAVREPLDDSAFGLGISIINIFLRKWGAKKFDTSLRTYYNNNNNNVRKNEKRRNKRNHTYSYNTHRRFFIYVATLVVAKLSLAKISHILYNMSSVFARDSPRYSNQRSFIPCSLGSFIVFLQLANISRESNSLEWLVFFLPYL